MKFSKQIDTPAHFQSAGAPKRSQIRDLVPNGTKVPIWSQKVPILPSSPKFLTVPSDAAEKRRHIAVIAVPYLDIYVQCIMCMYLILSGPLMRVSYLLTTRVFVFFCMFLQSHENND